MPASSTTGDIVWKKLDPKTWYLYNEPSGEEPKVEEPKVEEPKVEEPSVGRRTTRAEDELARRMFERDIANYGPQVATERAKRHQHIRLLGDFNYDLKRGTVDNFDARVRELLDSGALRVDQNGDLYSSVPLGQHATDRILSAMQTWQQMTWQQMQQAPQEEQIQEPAGGQ